MSDRDSYRRRQSASQPNLIVGSFNTANPSYYQVYKNFDLVTQYHSQIINDHAYRGEVPQKKFLAYPDDTLYKGDVIHWKSTTDYWIVVAVDDQYDSNTKGLIKQCSDSLLKWNDQYGALHTLPCVIEDAVGGDLNGGKVIWAIDDTIRVFTQYNSDIKNDTRFILWGKVFQVTGCSRVGGKNNLSAVYNMDITETLSAEDDFVNGIAYNSWDDNVWSIEVLNSPSSMVVGGTVTLDMAVKNNGIASSETLTYLSNNTSVATVSTSGVITGVANGNTSIKISLSSNPAVFTTVNIEVAAVASDNFVISLISPDGPLVDNDNLTMTVFADMGQDAYLTAQERNNGDLVNTTFTPSLTSGSAYISLSVTGVNTFALSPIAVGNAVLRIADAEGHFTTYTVYIKTMWG
jgi:hypothetical protein